MFQLIKLQESIADKEMTCDAVKGFFDYMRIVDEKRRGKLIVPLFNVRNMKINPTETYIHFQVVDEET